MSKSEIEFVNEQINRMSDLISKREIISEFENDLDCLEFGSALKGTFRGSIDISDVIERIKEFPSVDAVEVVHGHWFDVGSLSCRCSECGCKSGTETNFCPNCGAKMKGTY